MFSCHWPYGCSSPRRWAEGGRAPKKTTVRSASSSEEAIEALQRGRELLKKGEPDKALACFDEALHHDPGYVEAHCKRGTALLEKNQLEGAIAAFGEAIHLDPKCFDAYCGRAQALKEEGHLDRAVLDYTEAIALNAPSASVAYCGRAQPCSCGTPPIRPSTISIWRCGTIRGRPRPMAAGPWPTGTRARSTRPWPITPAPSNWSRRIRSGISSAAASTQKDDMRQAVADYSQAIQCDPQNADAYRLRARAYDALGDKTLVEADLAKAKELEENRK